MDVPKRELWQLLLLYQTDVFVVWVSHSAAPLVATDAGIEKVLQMTEMSIGVSAVAFVSLYSSLEWGRCVHSGNSMRHNLPLVARSRSFVIRPSLRTSYWGIDAVVKYSGRGIEVVI
jgi:hypothetical protein